MFQRKAINLEEELRQVCRFLETKKFIRSSGCSRFKFNWGKTESGIHILRRVGQIGYYRLTKTGADLGRNAQAKAAHGSNLTNCVSELWGIPPHHVIYQF